MFNQLKFTVTHTVVVCTALISLSASALEAVATSSDSLSTHTTVIDKNECHALFESIEVTKSDISTRSLLLTEQLSLLEVLESKIAPAEQYIADNKDKQEYSKDEAKYYNQQLQQLQKLVAEYNGLVSVYDATWQQHSLQISNTNIAITHYSSQCSQSQSGSGYVSTERNGS